MIILLYGQNEYLLRRKSKEILEKYRHKNQGLNLNRIDAEFSDFQDFWQEFRQKSMLVDRRLTIIENIFKGTEFKKHFRKQLEILASDQEVILAIETNKIKKTDQPLIDKIKKQGKVQEFPIASKAETRQWLSQLIESKQLNLTPETFETLINHIQNDWRKGEDIVSRLAVSDDQEETLNHLKGLAEELQPINVFHMTGAISQGMKGKAISLAHRYFSQGGRAEGLLPVVVYQFRQIIIVRDLIERGLDYYQIKKLVKIPSFAFNQVYVQAEKTKLDHLKKLYHDLFNLDYQTKTGQIDAKTGFDLFIARV